MKHLRKYKIFENGLDDDHKLINWTMYPIKNEYCYLTMDVFQELIDDYNIDSADGSANGIHYTIVYNVEWATNKYDMQINIFYIGDTFREKFMELCKIVGPTFKRIESIGYKIKVKNSGNHRDQITHIHVKINFPE